MKRPLVAPRELLDHVQQVGVRVARVVDPRRLVESDDIDDEGVAVPAPDGMSKVGGVERIAARMGAAVHVDLAPDVRRTFERHDDPLLLRQLDDLHWIRRRHQSRTARRQAISFRVVLRLVGDVVVVHCRRPRHEGDLRLELRAVVRQVVSDEPDDPA